MVYAVHHSSDNEHLFAKVLLLIRTQVFERFDLKLMLFKFNINNLLLYNARFLCLQIFLVRKILKGLGYVLINKGPLFRNNRGWYHRFIVFIILK